MSIKLNDNIKINAGKPSESKYLSTGNTAYSTTIEANAAIPIAERHIGLTLLIGTGITNLEYWWKEDVQDVDLIEKKFSSEQVVGDFITGATNLGYFTGQTGIQTLDLSGAGFGSDIGTYLSEYQWYYVDSDDIIKIGSPTNDGSFRRAYVNVARTKSWIYYVGSQAWEISSNDITANVGNSFIYSSHSGYVFTGVTWSGSEGNATASVTAYGSLTTGDTLTINTPIYRDKSYQNLNLRTITTQTPTTINISNDDNFIYISGFTDTTKIIDAENGLTKTGQVVKLGGTLTGSTSLTLTGSSSLTISDNRTIPVGIQYGGNYCDTFTATSLVDAQYVTGLTNGGVLIKNVCNTLITPYNMGLTDYYIGTSGGSIVTLLPNINGAAINGMSVVIADVVGNASVACPIQINGYFFGCGSVSAMETPFGSITFIYNGGKSCWGSIGFASAPY